MPTEKAPFYSMKFNRVDTLKRHKTKAAAKKAAGSFGMIYDTQKETQFHVHAMSNNTLNAYPEGGLNFTPMDAQMKVIIKDSLTD